MSGSAGSLVLFARAPRLGEVKTRLQPEFTPEESLAVHRALVRDAVGLLGSFSREAGVAGLVALSAPLEPGDPIGTALEGIEVVLQEGDDLGERLVRTFQARLQHGDRRVVIIGSDSPTLGPDYLRGAFEALEHEDIVIGPAEDGGYVLIGCSRLHVRPFQRVPWGTDRVLTETRKRLKKEGVPFRLLRSGHDLDTAGDLVRVYRELRHLEEVGASSPAPHTLAVLGDLARRRGEWG